MQMLAKTRSSKVIQISKVRMTKLKDEFRKVQQVQQQKE
jgi:hypothetical protein